MKKLFLTLMIAMIALALVACGEKKGEDNKVENNPSNSSESINNDVVAENNSKPAPSNSSTETTPAKGGTITLSKADLAVVVKGTPVQMPYKLQELEAAGVPADESRNEIKLGAGDLFTANLYLDDNEDYVLMPAYQNKGDSEINIAEAEAEEVTMTTYADNPVDQGVSILGVTFGMARKDVKALLGEPLSDGGDYLEWHLEIPDMAYEGTLSMYITEDSDEAGVSQVNLVVFAK